MTLTERILELWEELEGASQKRIVKSLLVVVEELARDQDAHAAAINELSQSIDRLRELSHTLERRINRLQGVHGA